MPGIKKDRCLFPDISKEKNLTSSPSSHQLLAKVESEFISSGFDACIFSWSIQVILIDCIPI